MESFSGQSSLPNPTNANPSDNQTCSTAAEDVLIFFIILYAAYLHLEKIRLKKKYVLVGYFGNVLGLLYGNFCDEPIDRYSILAGYLLNGLQLLLINAFNINKCGLGSLDSSYLIILDIILAISIAIICAIIRITYLKLQIRALLDNSFTQVNYSSVV